MAARPSSVRGDVFLPLAFYHLPPRTPPVPENPALIAHPAYHGYGYFPSDPNHLYRLPQAASITGAGTSADAPNGPAPPSAQFSVEIKNPGQPGAYVDFSIDGAAHRIDGGKRLKLSVSPGAKAAYDRGGGRNATVFAFGGRVRVPAGRIGLGALQARANSLAFSDDAIPVRANGKIRRRYEIHATSFRGDKV